MFFDGAGPGPRVLPGSSAAGLCPQGVCGREARRDEDDEGEAMGRSEEDDAIAMAISLHSSSDDRAF